jgi:hypothetical protein
MVLGGRGQIWTALTQFVNIPRPETHSATHCVARVVSTLRACHEGRRAYTSKLMKIKYVRNCAQMNNAFDALGKAIALLQGSTLWPRSATKF